MENKEIYTRDNIYSEMLKRVIIRCDFFEIIEIDRFVEEQKDFLSNYFEQRLPIEQNQCDVFINPSISNQNELPLSRNSKKKIYHFDCFKKQRIKATLDISADFICLNVLCENNYQGSGVFTELIHSLVKKMKDFDPFTCFNRIGIRKIDVQVLPSKRNRIDSYFDKTFWAGRSWDLTPEKLCSSLTEILKINDVNFNIIQRVDKIVRDEKRRLIYDVDAFIEKEYIAKCLHADKLIDCLNHEMQDKMFKLFRNVASVRYLRKCKEAKDAQSRQ